MTYKELLSKTRGESWTPPISLVALDPGLTTGLAYFADGIPKITEQIKCNDYELLMTIICSFEPDVVVYEDYRIYPGKLKAHSFSDMPTLKLIGAIEFMCQHNKYQSIKQMASVGKGFVSDEKLKDWGFYLKGKRHGNDALRHGCHALLFSKELI